MKLLALMFGTLALAVGLAITTAVLAPPSQGWVGIGAFPVTVLIWCFIIEPHYRHLWEEPDAQ